MKRKLLTTAGIESILTQYNIGNYQSRRFINTTIENQNYKLTTTKGVYLLKAFDTRDHESLKIQNNLLEHLHKRHIKVPELVHTRAKESLCTYKNQYFTIYTFVQGTHIKKLTPNLCKSLAREIAHMHNALTRYDFKGARKIPKYYPRAELIAIDYTQLRQSVIHGDLGRFNTLQKNQRVTAIIDFNDAHWDFLIKDLAVLIPMFLSKTNAKYIPVFLKEYQRHFSLNQSEIKSLLFFTRSHVNGVLDWLAKQKMTGQTAQQAEHTQKAIRYFNEVRKNTSYLSVL